MSSLYPLVPTLKHFGSWGLSPEASAAKCKSFFPYRALLNPCLLTHLSEPQDNLGGNAENHKPPSSLPFPQNSRLVLFPAFSLLGLTLSSPEPSSASLTNTPSSLKQSVVIPKAQEPEGLGICQEHRALCQRRNQGLSISLESWWLWQHSSLIGVSSSTTNMYFRRHYGYSSQGYNSSA